MDIDVFISHHTDSSIHIVEAIVNNLESNGIKCWYAPRDTKDDYAGSITRAIKQCKVFVLVLNKDASESPHVLNELNAVTKRLSKREEVHIIPFHTADDEISDEADYYIGRMHWIDAMTPPLEKRIDELSSRIILAIGKEKKQYSKSNDEIYRIVNEKIYADNYFKGREYELLEIHKTLTSSKNKIFLVGMGGSGKSELAKKYCQEYGEFFENIIWITFDKSLKESFSDDNLLPIYGLYRDNHLNKSIQEYFEYKLKVLKNISDNKTLIVIDNFDVDDDPDLDVICSGEYAILFTTRNHHIRSNLSELSLLQLEVDWQKALFQEIYKRKFEKDDYEYLLRILKILDSHVLSIRLVASVMNENRIKPKYMLEILNKKSDDESNAFYKRLWKIMNISNLTTEELFLMKNMALISLQGIEVEKMIEWCGLKSYTSIDSLIRKSWIIHNPVKDVIHLHPIVSELFFQHSKNNWNFSKKMLCNFFDECTDCVKTDYLYKQWLFALSDHLSKILPESHPDKDKIKLAKARMLSHLSLYTDSINMYKDIYPTLTNRKDRILALCMLSHLYCLNGYPELGLKTADYCMEKFFEKDISLYSAEEMYRYKGLITRLAESNRALGNYDEAIQYAEKALDFVTKHPESDSYHSLIWGKYHLARCLYMKNEDLARSEALFLDAISDCEKMEDTWTVSYCLQFLGQIYMKNGKLDLALSTTQKSLERLTLQYGEKNVDVAITYLLFGNIYRYFNNHTKATESYEKAITIFDMCGTPLLCEKAQRILRDNKIGYIS